MNLGLLSKIAPQVLRKSPSGADIRRATQLAHEEPDREVDDGKTAPHHPGIARKTAAQQETATFSAIRGSDSVISLIHRYKRPNDHQISRRATIFGLALAMSAFSGTALNRVPRAQAAPNPDVEYLYDVSVRRQYNFPNNDAVSYGHVICDKVIAGEHYPQLMGDVKNDVTPNDEFAANYLVSYAVNLLCPDMIWQLRNSAAGYQPPYA